QHLLLLGGTSEIGLGIISEFLENGPAKVSLAARADSPRVTDAVESLKAQGADVEVIDFDATGFESHPAVIDKAFERGDVDVGVLLGKKFKAQGHGTIVAMSSVAGMRVRRSNFVYGASKAGTDGFYVNLNEAQRGTGVNVLVVRPGQVRTKMSADAGEAPLTVNVDEVAEATVKAVLEGKDSIFVHPLFQYVSLAFKFIPQSIFRRLPF